MVNLISAMMPLLKALMKKAGITQHTLQIAPGTIVNIWIPSETIKKSKNTTTSATDGGDIMTKLSKPVVVLLHGFAGTGIITWPFQVVSLSNKYSVYVPDFLFFGGTTTDNADRSPTFQCLVKALRELGVERCTVVGFSYGGMVGFEMAELHPELVEAVVALTESITDDILKEIAFSSSPEFLMPTTVQGCKRLFKVAVHMKLWLPDRLFRDFLKVMFHNRKERSELLQGLIISYKDYTKPKFCQRIHLLWGGERPDLQAGTSSQHQSFVKRYRQLGDKATVESIKKAGHLVHLERPKAFNRCLKQFLASLHAHEATK